MRTAVLLSIALALAGCSEPAPDPRQLALVVSFDSMDPLVELQPLEPVVGDCLELPGDTTAQLNGETLQPLSLGGFVRLPASWDATACPSPRFSKPKGAPEFWSPRFDDVAVTLTAGGVHAGAEFPHEQSPHVLVASPQGPFHAGDLLELRIGPEVEQLDPEHTSLTIGRPDNTFVRVDGAQGGLAVDGARVLVPLRADYCVGTCSLDLTSRSLTSASPCDFGRCVLLRNVHASLDLEVLP